MESVEARDSKHSATNWFKQFKPFKPSPEVSKLWNVRGIERFEPFG
jgi:hypothetical protein